MKRTVHPRVCSVLVAAVFLALTGAAGAQTQATPDEEFKKIADAFSQAWATGDAKAIAALHTKDAIRLSGKARPPSALPLWKRAAIAGSLPQQR